MKKPKVVIFDMDGVIVETEELHSETFLHVLEEYDKKPRLQPNGLVQIPGVRERENWERIKAECGLHESVDTLIEKRSQVYTKLVVKNLHPKDGLVNLLNELKNQGIHRAVASSSVREHVDLILKTLNLTQEFEITISGDDIKHSKPHPEIFLVAAVKLRVKPDECVVIEDTPSGIEAAHRAHMQVVAVETRYLPREKLTRADYIVPNLTEFISLIT